MMDLINQCLDKKVLAPRLIHAAGNHKNANVKVLGARPAKKSKGWGVLLCQSSIVNSETLQPGIQKTGQNSSAESISLIIKSIS